MIYHLSKLPASKARTAERFAEAQGIPRVRKGDPVPGLREDRDRKGRESEKWGKSGKKKKSIKKLKEIRHEVGECCGNEIMESKQNTDPLRTLLRFF